MIIGLLILLATYVQVPTAQASGPPQNAHLPKQCKDWFEKAKLLREKDCALKCALLDSDMSNFDCSRFCDQLCSESSQTQEPEIKLSALYPGLTDPEKKFIDQHPKDAVKAYWLSWRAEGICKDKYLVSDTNDESDACRHFVWAALLNRQFGAKTASDILDAHEQNPDEPEDEKSMDLANNRRGIIVSSEMLKRSKELKDAEILSQFLSDLNEGKIIVLKRRKK